MAEIGLPADLKVALIHDWLTGMRGGEKCLEVFCELFPKADIYTLLHVPGSVSETISSHRIFTSFVNRFPAAARTYRWGLPIFPRAVEQFDLAGYDLVLSSSHCVAKSAPAPPGALSACYCHTPMRYVWDRFDDYFGQKPRGQRWLIGRVAASLRRWDVATANRVQLWLANSTVVRERIVTFYHVPQDRIDIIHPPVDTQLFAAEATALPPEGLKSGSYDLVVSALVAYKRIDLAVQAAKRAGRTLVVVGRGPEAGRLHQLAEQAEGSGKVLFAGPVSSEDLPAYYAHCRAFLFPGLEDFGITPLEATACGRPVVAFRGGGALDSVREGLNGLFFAEQGVTALTAALNDPRLDGEWDTSAMTAHAEQFSRERFREEISDRLALAWQRHQAGEHRV